MPLEIPAKARSPLQHGMLPDVQFENGLPAAIDAERSILGAILLDNPLLKEAEGRLRPEDFALDQHRRIYRRMVDLAQDHRAVDIITLPEVLARHKELDAAGGVAYLASLTENMPRRISILEYIAIVAEKSVQRELIGACASAIEATAGNRDQSFTLTASLAEKLAAITSRSNVIWHRKSSRKVLAGAMDFLADVQPEVDWAVESLIQRGGNGLLVGDPGTAKSMLAFDLALHLVAGVPWLGRRIPRRVRVGLISREDHPSLSKQRGVHLIAGADLDLQEALEEIDFNDWLYFNSVAQTDSFSLTADGDVAEMIEALRDARVEFAIFDVFRRLWDGDENDNQEVAKVLAILTRIQREVGCSVVLIHHVNKGVGPIFNRVRGASAIYGWREWAMGITIENPGDAQEKRVRKIEFETKADMPSNPIYFQVVGQPGKTTIMLSDPPERPQRVRAKRRGYGEQSGSLYGDTSSWHDRG